MLGALRDEVVPEVLGGRPADDAGPEPEAPDAPAPDERAADPAVGQTDGADVEDAVDDTGDVTRSAALADPATEPESAAVLDQACAAAVDLARDAALLEAGAVVGEHLGAEPEDALTVTHSFATLDPAYVGWRWAVTVARAEGSDVVTVDEVVLLPGSDALLAPAWVPYSARVQPGDLGTADLLPPGPDDPRLVPAYADPEAELAAELFWELGLGRPRVLSLDGRADAAERWEDGDTGPRSPRALAAPGHCAGCGFLVPLGGALRQGFGVCANAQAPDDGRVVALAHGCGAHSETPVELTRTPVAELVVDEVEFEFEDRERDAPQASAEPDDAPAGTPDAAPAGAPAGAPADAPADPLPDPADEQQAEELGHS
ncbi:MAG: hypothetical protein JWO60_856 [Frankiales bacterium]|nr:hypothetical protein [Frankiales bacterium]